MSGHPDETADTHEAFDGSFSGTRQRQILAGLELDPTARLRWLERTIADLQRLSAGPVKPGR
jgi:hypothetical protein